MHVEGLARLYVAVLVYNNKRRWKYAAAVSTFPWNKI
jgi:hypothetical protein